TLAQVQITLVAVAAALVAALAGEPLVPLPRVVWGAVAFNGVLATSVALGLQNWLQGKTSATHAALIFVLEPVFAAMFGWILAGETLDLRGWVGSTMILAGMIIGQRNNRSGAAPAKKEEPRGTSR
ncbi:MAG: DMT family transporter, partial [Anaerolineae bacterium]